MGDHSLYRFFGFDGALLYIGRTVSPSRRWLEHARSKQWWCDVAKVERERFDSADELAEAERDAIHEERPLHNVRFNYPKPPAATAPAEPEERPTRLLYGKVDAAERLGMSVRSMDRLISEGLIESVSIGRRRLVPHAALEDYVARLRKAS